MGRAVVVHGVCDPAFEPVRQAFESNFANGLDTGAALSVSVRGRRVVDLWGGWADVERTRPWDQDTVVCLFSCTKGLLALLCLMLVDAGRLDLDAPVSRIWPEFAQAGKEELPFRYLLTHQAGLSAVRSAMPSGSLTDWAAMTEALAETEPWWTPGKGHGYHGVTYGFLVGEVLHRLDGRMPSELFADVVAGPLGLDLALRATPQFADRIADLHLAPMGRTYFDHWAPDGLGARSFWNPPDCNDIELTNSGSFRSAEIPGANGFGTARALDDAYRPLASGGRVGERRILSSALVAEAAAVHVYGQDLVMDLPTAFGLGFEHSIPEWRFGPSAAAFGHNGSGGSLGLADPAAELSLGYVMNRLVWGETRDDPRWPAMFDAIYGAL